MDGGIQSSAALHRENYSAEDIENILFHKSYEETFCKLGAKGVYHKLLHLKKKEIELHLHGVSLSDYYKDRRIHRGFRINNTPTLGRTNPAFGKRWCQILDRCSLDLMLLVVEEVGRELKAVRTDLAGFEVANRIILQADRETDWLVRLEEQTGEYKAELLEFKNFKRLKVIQDYKEASIYRWQQGGSANPRRRRPEWRGRRSPSHRSVSGTSESEGEASAIESQRPQGIFFRGSPTCQQGSRKATRRSRRGQAGKDTVAGAAGGRPSQRRKYDL